MSFDKLRDALDAVREEVSTPFSLNVIIKEGCIEIHNTGEGDFVSATITLLPSGDYETVMSKVVKI